MVFDSISHYRIIEKLGAGGMGEVYKAQDMKLGRTVALKFFSLQSLEESEVRTRLVAEAQASASLNHPNIATVYEIGHDNGISYIAMEYVEGRGLDSIIEGGALELTSAIDISIQIAEALKTAHARGLIHCDIKSSNIMLTTDDRVKLLDYGLAKAAFNGAAGISRQQADAGKTMAGTLGYMSPEQLRAERLDDRTDIFSLGVVLFEMLTGQRPFDGESRSALIRSILSDEPQRIGWYREDAPLELESIVRRLLEKNADERYRTAGDVLVDLKKLRQRLDNHAAEISQAASESTGSNITASAEPPAFHPARFADALRALGWRYRRLLLLAGLLALTAAVISWAVSFERAQTTSIILSLVGVICLTTYAVARNRRVIPAYSLQAGAAFRGLLPFQEADRDRFFGRESDALALLEKVCHGEFRFGVLFGESGSGKTSLLRAGLLPRLWEKGYIPIYCRSYRDPLASVLEECRKRSQIDKSECEPPTEYLKRVSAELGGPVVVLLDQFEEFFISFKSRGEREPFLSFVAECHACDEPWVRFLFSMRSDFLYLINSEFAERVPEPLSTTKLYHLKNFDEAQAAEIIEKSARKANLALDSELSRYVARDLSTLGTVLPSELQIVGERLQNRRIFSVEAYRRAGGKESLVHSFLEDVIQASGDREGCGLLLRSLVSDENTRLTLTAGEIARRTQRGRDRVGQMLSSFVSSRLVREIQEDEPWRYELMHEYLIEKINRITGRVMDATQRANRLLRQYASDYSVDRRTRIPVAKLWFIRRYSDIERGEHERELMKNSLRSGVMKMSAAALLLAIATTLAAAALSVRDEWVGVRLSDGHAVAVRRAVFSPDGRRLVTSGEDGKIIVWDFASRERIATLNYNSMEPGTSDSIPNGTSLAYSPDGKWIASLGEQDAVIVWDATQFIKTAILGGHGDQVSTISFSPDGKYLLTSSSGGNRTIIWETGRWVKLRELHISSGAPNFLFSPDSKRFILAEPLSAWDIDTGKQLSDEIDAEIRGTRAAISPDGSRIVGLKPGGIAYFLRAGDWAGGVKPELIDAKEGHKYYARDVVFSPDGRMVVTGCEDIVLWDADTRTILARFEHTDNVWSLAFSRDGRWLVSTHGDGAILLWDITERKRVASFNEHTDSVNALAFSPDGNRVASSGKDQSLIIWNAKSGKKEATLILDEHSPIKYGEGITNITFSDEGMSLVGVSTPQVLLSNIASRQTREIFTLDIKKGEYIYAVSTDLRWIATQRAVYKFEGGEQVAEFDSRIAEPPPSINAMAFSPDGRWLLRASFSGEVYVWDTQDWRLAGETNITDARLGKLAFSPDGKMFVTGSIDGEVRLWQTWPLRQLGLLGNHQSIVLSLAFSPDGSEVVSSGDDLTIALWDVERRKLKTYIGQQNASVMSLAFSADGQRLACGGRDGLVRIYTRNRKLWNFRLD